MNFWSIGLLPVDTVSACVFMRMQLAVLKRAEDFLAVDYRLPLHLEEQKFCMSKTFCMSQLFTVYDDLAYAQMATSIIFSYCMASKARMSMNHVLG